MLLQGVKGCKCALFYVDRTDTCLKLPRLFPFLFCVACVDRHSGCEKRVLSYVVALTLVWGLQTVGLKVSGSRLDKEDALIAYLEKRDEDWFSQQVIWSLATLVTRGL